VPVTRSPASDTAEPTGRLFHELGGTTRLERRANLACIDCRSQPATASSASNQIKFAAAHCRTKKPARTERAVKRRKLRCGSSVVAEDNVKLDGIANELRSRGGKKAKKMRTREPLDRAVAPLCWAVRTLKLWFDAAHMSGICSTGWVCRRSRSHHHLSIPPSNIAPHFFEMVDTGMGTNVVPQASDFAA
jgi:hypothetical protein